MCSRDILLEILLSLITPVEISCAWTQIMAHFPFRPHHEKQEDHVPKLRGGGSLAPMSSAILVPKREVVHSPNNRVTYSDLPAVAYTTEMTSAGPTPE